VNTLQDLLIILGDQKLAAGYLQPADANANPAASGTAHNTLRALKRKFDPFVLAQNPLPGMTNQVGAPNTLFCPAWLGSLGAGQDAIFLDGVDGTLDLSHTPKPAYLFSP
jgi:hypothetical protein